MLYIADSLSHLLVIDGEYGDDYQKVMTIHWLGRDKVFLEAFLGREEYVLNKAEYKEFHQIMVDRGVKEIEEIRHGKRRIRRIG